MPVHSGIELEFGNICWLAGNCFETVLEMLCWLPETVLSHAWVIIFSVVHSSTLFQCPADLLALLVSSIYCYMKIGWFRQRHLG